MAGGGMARGMEGPRARAAEMGFPPWFFCSFLLLFFFLRVFFWNFGRDNAMKKIVLCCDGFCVRRGRGSAGEERENLFRRRCRFQRDVFTFFFKERQKRQSFFSRSFPFSRRCTRTLLVEKESV